MVKIDGNMQTGPTARKNVIVMRALIVLASAVAHDATIVASSCSRSPQMFATKGPSAKHPKYAVANLSDTRCTAPGLGGMEERV